MAQASSSEWPAPDRIVRCCIRTFSSLICHPPDSTGFSRTLRSFMYRSVNSPKSSATSPRLSRSVVSCCVRIREAATRRAGLMDDMDVSMIWKPGAPTLPTQAFGNCTTTIVRQGGRERNSNGSSRYGAGVEISTRMVSRLTDIRRSFSEHEPQMSSRCSG